MFSNVLVLGAVVFVLMFCAVANAGEVVHIEEIPYHIIRDNSRAKKEWRGKEVRIKGIVRERNNGWIKFSCILKGNIFDYVFFVDRSSATEIEIGQTVLMAGTVEKWSIRKEDEVYRITIFLQSSRLV